MVGVGGRRWSVRRCRDEGYLWFLKDGGEWNGADEKEMEFEE